MLWTILIILLIVWLIGFLFDIAGALIHIALIAAAVILVIKVIRMIAGG